MPEPYYVFEVGMRIRAKKEKPPGLTADEWIVKRVVHAAECCDCNRGTAVVELMGHGPSCISRVWNLECGHHQQLFMDDQDGRERRLSGDWFMPVTQATAAA